MNEATQNEDLFSYFNEEWSEGGNQVGAGRPWGPEDNKTIEWGVMPPMGDLRSNPDGWKAWHAIHWGYSVPRKDDPTKTRKISFYCIQKKGRGGMILQPCPQCVKNDEQYRARENYKAELTAKGKSDEDIKALTKPLSDWLRNFNTDKKWWIFAMNINGEFNRAKLSFKTFQQLEAGMKKVFEENKINPRSPRNLVIWNVTRFGSAKTGIGNMSEKIESATETVMVGNRQLFDVKKVSLTEDLLRKAMSTYDKIGGISDVAEFRLSYEQIDSLVQSNSDPEQVARIVGLSNKPYTPPVSAPSTERSMPRPETPSTDVSSISDEALWDKLGIDPKTLGIGR